MARVSTPEEAHQIELRGILPQEEGEAKEMGVLLGKQAKLPVRLIMVRVSDEVAKQRRQRICEAAQAHGREPSEEVLYPGRAGPW